MDIDMSRGVYRKVYSGFITGKRINSVSIEAEAWFWRLHALADDFGNLHGCPVLLASLASPRRKVTTEAVSGWVDELVGAGLARKYSHDGEDYLHLIGFQESQPSGKNGRRFQRHPREPEQSGAIRGNPEQSGGIRPSESDAYAYSESDTDTNSEAGDARGSDRAAVRVGLDGRWPLADIDGILAAYPSAGRSRPVPARRAVSDALDALAHRGQADPPAWLLRRVRAYAASPLGKAGSFAGGVLGWMRDGRYDEPPEAWARETPGDNGHDAPATDYAALVAKALEPKR